MLQSHTEQHRLYTYLVETKRYIAQLTPALKHMVIFVKTFATPTIAFISDIQQRDIVNSETCWSCQAWTSATIAARFNSDRYNPILDRSWLSSSGQQCFPFALFSRRRLSLSLFWSRHTSYTVCYSFDRGLKEFVLCILFIYINNYNS